MTIEHKAGRRRVRSLALPPVLVAVCLASYGSTLAGLAARWSADARYSHGFLVPLFALYLLWARRGQHARDSGSGFESERVGLAALAGLMMIAAGVSLRYAGTRYFVSWLEEISLLPALAGVALLVGGLNGLRWAVPAILFLAFMVPLPYRAERFFGHPLQGVATAASTYLLQTIGLGAVSEGNIIYLDHARIGVVEACNGLGMLVMFFAFTVGAVLVMRRSVAENAFIVLSAVPIALGANVLRIAITGVLHELVGASAANTFYHALAGWLMMPLALAALQLELLLLDHVFVRGEIPDTLSFRPGPTRGRDATSGLQPQS